MLVSKGTYAEVYRSRDARRSVLCIVETASFEPLIAAGLLCVLEGHEGRWVWAGSPPAEAPLQVPDFDKPRKALNRPLAFILQAEEDAKQQAYLAQAAFRYISDYELFHKGRPVTMNWTFVPGGKTRIAASATGLDTMSLNAGRVLDTLNAHLDMQDTLLLSAVLIQTKPMYRLLDEFDMQRDGFAKLGLRVLYKLARLYDMAAPKAQY